MIQPKEDEEIIEQLPVIEAPIAPKNSTEDKFMRKITTAFRQVGEIIDYETQALRSNAHPDFHEINTKKARSLQTLSQLSNEAEGITLNESYRAEFQTHMEALQDKLSRNQHLLQTHMEAVGELVEMIHAAADERETDGTYDPYSHAKQNYKG